MNNNIQKRILLFIIFVSFIIISSYCYALSETEPPNNKPSILSFKLAPRVTFPIGKSVTYYKFGGGIVLSGEYKLPSRRLFTLNGQFNYDFVPIKANTSLSILSLGFGGGINYLITPKLNAKGSVISGIYYGFFNDKSSSVSAIDPYVSACTGIYYLVFPSLSFNAEGTYLSFFGLNYNSIVVSIGVTYHIGGSKKLKSEKEAKPSVLEPLQRKTIDEEPQKLEIKKVEFGNIFPVLFKYYDNHPIGKVVLRNTGNEPITDIKVNLFVKQYMDNPKECEVPVVLKSGEEKEVELFALFTNKVLEITEGTKVSISLTFEYSTGGKIYKSEKIETVRLYDRNAITWADNRRAAAFITAKDPTVLTFSKNTTGIVKKEGINALNENLRKAIALHEALSLYGINYIVDPKTPYSVFSRNRNAVDFLQFPRQTLKYKAGDCDDLSILYCALLESVGIETAFITVPGHIFMAFSANISPQEARKVFSHSDELIFRNGRVWVPLEVTKTNEDFLDAWETGAREWRESGVKKEANFYPVHEAWEVYEPVGLLGEELTIDLPAINKVAKLYEKELTALIDRELYPKIANMQKEVAENEGDIKTINNLGVLYAKYGLLEKAEHEFRYALEKDKEYIPAIVNIGNIHYLKKEIDTALQYYEQAYKIQPSNPTVLLNVAKAEHELENYGYAQKAYNKLKTLDPALAMKFSYLGLRGDVSDRGFEARNLMEAVIWLEN